MKKFVNVLGKLISIIIFSVNVFYFIIFRIVRYINKVI